jgi:hypothetical protein
MKMKSKMENRNSRINKEWHLANKMPKNPSLDQRVEWHLEHARNCTCRPLGGKILEEIERRDLKV